MSNLSNEKVGTIVDQQRLISKARTKEQVMSSISMPWYWVDTSNSTDCLKRLKGYPAVT